MTLYQNLKPQEQNLFNRIDALMNECDNKNIKINIFKALLEKYDKEKPDYKRAYNLLMMFWDNIPEEDKNNLDKALKECGL